MNKKARRKYNREFKQEAVKLATEQGYKVSEAAGNLGIRANMLTRWKRELESESVVGMEQNTQLVVVEFEKWKEENRLGN